MSIELALATVIVVAMVGNRFFSLITGMILKVPPAWLLPTLYAMDVMQIPLYYWVYERGSHVTKYFPARVRSWFDDKPKTRSHWTASLGGLGVFVVALLPTLGGGMWSAVFLAYGLRIRKTWGYFLMAAGSLVSYICLYWVLDSLFSALRHFSMIPL